MNFRRKNVEEEPGFQMAPMIDIIFVLLLFFLVTSALEENEKMLTIDLPQAGQAGPNTQSFTELIININKKGDVIIKNEKMSLKLLSERLIQLAELYKGIGIPAVIVRGDKNASYGRVVEVLDICAKAKMHNVSFVTVEKE
ncbi:MAG: biopolymer transporter ExbD [Planctomycetota bacterium]|nr:biopolymer transporter ExbD [Planctomycetota bacterium]MDA1140442.1 biopolymer transporter ExbD [Planctomycetota bacterium]